MTAWFCSRELIPEKKLSEQLTGKPNEKATLVNKK